MVEWAGGWSILPEKWDGAAEETKLDNDRRAADTCERKLHRPFQILRNGKPRKRRIDKGKGRLDVEGEETDRALPKAGLPPPQLL